MAAEAAALLLDGELSAADLSRLAEVAAAHASDPEAQAAAVLHAAACLPEYQLS